MTCLKSPNAGATAAQLQACRLSAVSPPSGVRPPPWDLMDQGAAWPHKQPLPPRAGRRGLPTQGLWASSLPAFSHKQGISGASWGPFVGMHRAACPRQLGPWVTGRSECNLGVRGLSLVRPLSWPRQCAPERTS